MLPLSLGGGGVLVLGVLDGVLLGERVGVVFGLSGAFVVEPSVGPSVASVVGPSVAPVVGPSVGPSVGLLVGPSVGVWPGVVGVPVGDGVPELGVPDGVPGVVADGLATIGLVEDLMYVSSSRVTYGTEASASLDCGWWSRIQEIGVITRMTVPIDTMIRLARPCGRAAALLLRRRPADRSDITCVFPSRSRPQRRASFVSPWRREVRPMV
jgi:hypothetical protein